MTKGLTFRKPDGTLDYRITSSVESAQSNAAFHLTERNGIELPRDWDLAYAAGYRIVPAEIRITGKARGTWRTYGGHGK